MRTQILGLLKVPLLVLLAIATFDTQAFNGLMDNTKLKRVAVKDVDGSLDIIIDTVNGPIKDGYLEIDKIQVMDTGSGKFYMIMAQSGFKDLLQKQEFKEQLCRLIETMTQDTDDIVTFGYVDETYAKDTFGIIVTKDGGVVVTEKTAVIDFQVLDDRIVAKLVDNTTGYIDGDQVIGAFMDRDFVHIGACTPLEQGDKFARVKKDGVPCAAYTHDGKLYFLDRDDASQLDGEGIDLKHPDMKNTSVFMNGDSAFIAGQIGTEDFVYKKFDGKIDQISA